MLASHLSPGMVGIIRQPPCLFEERTYILRITYGVVPKAKENLPGVLNLIMAAIILCLLASLDAQHQLAVDLPLNKTPDAWSIEVCKPFL